MLPCNSFSHYEFAHRAVSIYNPDTQNVCRLARGIQTPLSSARALAPSGTFRVYRFIRVISSIVIRTRKVANRKRFVRVFSSNPFFYLDRFFFSEMTEEKEVKKERKRTRCIYPFRNIDKPPFRRRMHFRTQMSRK